MNIFIIIFSLFILPIPVFWILVLVYLVLYGEMERKKGYRSIKGYNNLLYSNEHSIYIKKDGGTKNSHKIYDQKTEG